MNATVAPPDPSTATCGSRPDASAPLAYLRLTTSPTVPSALRTTLLMGPENLSWLQTIVALPSGSSATSGLTVFPVPSVISRGSCHAVAPAGRNAA